MRGRSAGAVRAGYKQHWFPICLEPQRNLPPMQKTTAVAPAQAQSKPFLAIGLLCAACALFACGDTTAKYLATVVGAPIGQVVWMRYIGQLVGTIAMLGLIALPDMLRTTRLKAQLFRSVLLLISTLCNFWALRYLRLDQTATISFLTPMMVALLAGPFLGEWIGWRRAIGIVVGFSGILIAFRPGFTEFHPAFLVSMGSMLAYAFFSLVTRYLAPYDRAEVTLFYSLFAGTILAAPFAWAQWMPPDGLVGWTLMLSMGLYSGLGHYLFIVAHRYAPASTLMPFIYITLLTHTAAGYLVFDQLPDSWTMAGAAVVVLSGLYLLHRERVTLRAAAVSMTVDAAKQR
jgi:drug/metabolite transporter (DMT)-like permease